MQALCAAEAQLLGHWQQDAADLRAFMEGPVAATASRLRELSSRLPAAMAQELAAFRRREAPPAPPRQQLPAAAHKLDPLCHLRQPEHLAGLAKEAGAEVGQLQPEHQRWTELLRRGAAQLQALEAAAAGAEAEAAALAESSGGAAQQLQAATSAAEDGAAAAQAVRSALTEWWSSPALYCAGPDLKGESRAGRGRESVHLLNLPCTLKPHHPRPSPAVDGKTAPEWLRLLSEQRDALDRRALSDCSNAAA